MKRQVTLEFSGFGVPIELDDSKSPKTVKAIIESLPIRVTINRWGDELYTDQTQVKAKEENAQSAVSLYDVAYWPEGSALCFFYGPTPVSKDNKILPYSQVNIIGRIAVKPADVQEFLKRIEKLHIEKKAPVTLR